MKLKSIEAFVVLNMNGFDKVSAGPPNAPVLKPQTPFQMSVPLRVLTVRCKILRKHDLLLGANTRDDFLRTVAWRSIM